ncbi:MAG: NAD(P)/FAD-dependent oxidoreductase [Lachnospiraceae bacterium]|nr:MAG: NAD(P)/FAD-dependent oxidoreductase [Lachnospiraceae bacterium]
MMDYDVIIIGAGASGVFASYEFTKMDTNAKILMIDSGNHINKRVCPISEGKVKNCIKCTPCNIMKGFGGAGSLSDGKYNITNNFGGDLYKHIGKNEALDYMEYVDKVLCDFDGQYVKLYSTSNSSIKTLAIKNDLHLLDAKVRHFGTDRNINILKKITDYISKKVEVIYNTTVNTLEHKDGKFYISTDKKGDFSAKYIILAAGRSGSKWIGDICDKMNIPTKKNKVDIGVRVELPAEVFKHITDEVYESKIVYQTRKYNDLVRTFCMNPYGDEVAENTNGVVTVNGHSYSDPSLQSENTNFALLVSNTFTEPFKNSNEYGESIARLSNMLGGGVLLQRFGDLKRGKRSTQGSIQKGFITPTLDATPGDLSLVIPKRQLDSIIEMIEALDKIAPGTANNDTLLYGVEVKFYNSNVEVNENLETNIDNFYVVGDGSGVTHSLSQASASGVYVARKIDEKIKNNI